MFNIDSLGRILIKSGILPATARSQYEARKGVLQIKVNRFCRKSPKKYSADSRVKMRTANRTPSKIGGSQMTK